MILKPKRFIRLLVLLLVFTGIWVLSIQPSAPAVTFVAIDGRELSMSSLRGKVVLVNFWATSCPSCTEEMPQLIQLYNQYRTHGLELVAVAMSSDTLAQVKHYSKQKLIPFPVVHDALGKLASAFGDVRLTPTLFVFDKAGHQVQQRMGTLNFVELKHALTQELH